jgi:hypothetical protein
MEDGLAKVLPNGHIVLPPEFQDLLKEVKTFVVSKRDGSLVLTPYTVEQEKLSEPEGELLSPALQRLAFQKRTELAEWETTRKRTSESKMGALVLVGMIENTDLPPDTSESFRDYLYGAK